MRQPRHTFAALDGIRALAAFAVVCSHVGFDSGRSLKSDALAPILSRGNFGVTVFFLLSGFLLYRPFALHSFGLAPKPQTGRFLWRRAVRIFPALWVMTALTLAFITPRPVQPSDWPSYLLLIETYNHHDNDGNLTQLWTLAVEIMFYALLPVLAALVGGPSRNADTVLRRQATLLGALVVVTISFNLAVTHRLITHTQSALWLPNYLDWFAGGMALALITAVPAEVTALAKARRTVQVWAGRPETCWLIAALLFLISTLPLGTPRTLAPATFWQWTLQHYLYLAAAFFILLPFVLGTAGRVASVLGARIAGVLGSISYSVYLWHPAIMQWLQRRFGWATFSGHFVALLVLTLACTIVVASVSWYVLEQPLMRYGARGWRGSTTAATAPAAKAATHIS